MKKADKYPWHRIQRGGSFFVPALDVNATVIEGKRMAVKVLGTAAVKAVPCIYDGMLGVMFRRA